MTLFAVVLAAVALGAIGGALLGRAWGRRPATRALAESEARFEALVQGVIDYAIFMLDADGKVATWNAGAERIKGYTAAEIIGKPYATFYTEDDRRAGLPQRVLATAAAEGRFEGEAWRVRKDGTLFWANVVLDAIRDPQGRLIGYAKVTRDLTERRAMEERLHQAQKMEAIGRLTGGIAHDFNNMLTVIINGVRLAKRRGEITHPEALRHLDLALKGADSAALLTQRLLAFSRRQTLVPMVVDVNKLVGTMSELLLSTLGEAIRIETVLAGGLWRARVDANQLEHAIINLAVNARDAMPQGGRLTIETENSHLDPAYAAQHEGLRPGQYVMIAVSDTGTGMTTEVMRRAFEPFFTTKEVGQGSGMGLSQVFGFAKQSGGHVSLYSEPGHGTTVKLYLPREVQAEAAALQPATAEETAPAQRQETILVVEDNELVRAQSTAMLRELGFRVREAADGPAALASLGRDPAVDLLFTDIGLPGGLNGRELAEEARRRHPALKVLFTTGYARNAFTNGQGLEAAGQLLPKPFTEEQLTRKIGEVLGTPDSPPRP